VQLQAVLRLPAAHGFLAQWRLQKAHKQMRDQEAALAAVAFAFDAEGCDLDSLVGYQQLCRSADVSKGAHGVFPVDGVLQLYGDGGRGGVFLLITSGDARTSPLAFVATASRWLCSCTPLVQMVFMGSRWLYTCNFVMQMVPTVRETQ
jgi:hypothetical protein